MKNSSAALARSITRSSSKQSYAIARLLADRDLVDDCLRAYAYFRWADDVIDVCSRSAEERLIFIRGQKRLVDRLYEGERPDDLTPEEEMVADLIAHDRAENSGLQSFIRCFVEVLEFDAGRKGKLISQAELTWYSGQLGKAVTDAIQYFIGNQHTYGGSHNHYLAATAAHVTHMLRDMAEDLSEGFINVPNEWLAEHDFGCGAEDIDPSIVEDPDFRAWVQSQVALARLYFREGKSYLDGLDVLRCKIAAYWYCARFECVLKAIENDGYVLRRHYHERDKLSTKLKMGWLAVLLTFRHYIQRGRGNSWDATTHSGFETKAIEHQGRAIIARRD
jgi:phytoene/squalene synthetase